MNSEPPDHQQDNEGCQPASIQQQREPSAHRLRRALFDFPFSRFLTERSIRWIYKAVMAFLALKLCVYLLNLALAVFTFYQMSQATNALKVKLTSVYQASLLKMPFSLIEFLASILLQLVLARVFLEIALVILRMGRAAQVIEERPE